MRRKIIAGNWKMHLLTDSVVDLAKSLADSIKDVDDIDIAIFPPAPYLILMKEVLKDSNIKYGAQNMYFAEKGAFTGELSAGMLKDIGCKLVLIGHSERRKIFKESNELINSKLIAAINLHLTPYLCIGETLEERESGKLFEVIEEQLSTGLKNILEDDFNKIVVAYEPVWAIGTGKTATPEIAQEMHQFIRNWIKKNYSENASEKMRILYGGSMKPENVKSLISQPDIDGGLVGGASLKSESFSQIIRFSR